MRIKNNQERPRCEESGCDKHSALIKDHKDGTKTWRRWCSEHHNKRTGAKHGLKNINEVVARKRGFKSSVAYRNSTHEYRKYRKNYCENQDGRVGGFNCTAYIPWEGILQVDHIDGNPSNNDPSNLQTLCANCHAHKSNLNGDHNTPGRKALKNKTIADKANPIILKDILEELCG